ncbi:MAG: hypothetical protein IJQ66_00815 [Clostridia bacterium]|nr:hypothetical protein [Clostridia bacterium]
MLTYVINTSENKTFDSDQLFKLVGYNKICWLNYSLNDLEKCAEEICERQIVLGADDFRIAVLVDFYGFKKVRSVYGYNGYSDKEQGVDLSVYFAFLESYMMDHLFDKIQRKELFVKEREVFYIQDGRQEEYSIIENEEAQIEYILHPVENSVTEITTVKMARSELEKLNAEAIDNVEEEKPLTDEERTSIISEFDEKWKALKSSSVDEIIKTQQKEQKVKLAEEATEYEEDEKEEVYIDVPEKRYAEFELYCTENLSLTFKVSDYPYTNKRGLTRHEFFMAFKERGHHLYKIKRHHYLASFGSGIAKAAFDNLSLFLYLIKMYEREEKIKENDEFVIDSLEPEKLKNMLILSWNKICSARLIALENTSKYYDIKSFVGVKPDFEDRDKTIKDNFISESKNKAVDEYRKSNVEEIYKKICAIMSENESGFSEKDKNDLNDIMAAYLKKRDEVKESVSEDEFRSVKEDCKMISQCPSKNDYDNIMEKKKAVISEILTKTINIEYIKKDFDESKEKADKAYKTYLDAKNYLNKNIIADVIVLIFAVLIMVIPFIAIKRWNLSFELLNLYLFTSETFAALYVLAFFIMVIPLLIRLRNAKSILKECYVDCRVQQDMAIAEFRRRYEDDLIQIENLRYELRHITKLYEHNLAKNRNIEKHRQMLELVENKLSAMLNNLGVEPVVVRYTNLEDEFDVSKSFMSNDNKIYKIFSLDAIEQLFGARRR